MEQCKVLTGCLSLGRRPGGDWTNTWPDKTFYSLFKQKVVAAPSYLGIVFLIAFLEEGLLELQ